MYRILELNPQLEPFSGDIDLRMHLYRSTKKRILSEGQSLNDFANAHLYFGFHHVDGGCCLLYTSVSRSPEAVDHMGKPGGEQ